MLTTNRTLLDVEIRTAELEQHKDAKALGIYIDDVVLPLIQTAITSLPKERGGSLGVVCDRDGCRVEGRYNI
jgi:hypothetical protein